MRISAQLFGRGVHRSATGQGSADGDYAGFAPEIEEVTELSDTERREGGFGSTGK